MFLKHLPLYFKAEFLRCVEVTRSHLDAEQQATAAAVQEGGVGSDQTALSLRKLVKCKLHSGGCRVRGKLQTIVWREREKWQGGVLESGNREPLSIAWLGGVGVAAAFKREAQYTIRKAQRSEGFNSPHAL